MPEMIDHVVRAKGVENSEMCGKERVCRKGETIWEKATDNIEGK